jgi:hypothetical protein
VGDHVYVVAAGTATPCATLTVTTTAAAPAVRIRWTGVSGQTAYRVYRDGTTIADRIVKTPSLSFTDGNDGKRHDYYVTAVDSNFNESLPSLPAIFPGL